MARSSLLAVLAVSSVALGYASPASAWGGGGGGWGGGGHFTPVGFTANLTNCVESIGVGLAPTSVAQTYVPADFILASGGAPVTPMVVRTSRCDGISFGGGFALPVVVIQVGAVIVPPTGMGDIDNYTFWYYTSNLDLALHLIGAGVSAQWDPFINFGYDRDVPSTDTSFSVNVPWPGSPTFSVSGTVTPSVAPSGSFDSLWWTNVAAGDATTLTTDVPVIDIGSADLTLTTSATDPLGQLFGSGSVSFPIIQQFNFFANATLTATVAADP